MKLCNCIQIIYVEKSYNELLFFANNYNSVRRDIETIFESLHLLLAI